MGSFGQPDPGNGRKVNDTSFTGIKSAKNNFAIFFISGLFINFKQESKLWLFHFLTPHQKY